MKVAIAPYRLRFNHPFGTAHGLRDGTDSVFIRLSQHGVMGFGEATLPPYIGYSQLAVIQEITCFLLKHKFDSLRPIFNAPPTLALSPPARTALNIAHIDLITKLKYTSASTEFNIEPVHGNAWSMVTLGYSDLVDIPLKLKELPRSKVLKVKLGAPNDLDVVDCIKQLDSRPLFLDANQGWQTLGEAERTIEAVGKDRIIGVEQPFAKERWDLHRALKDRLGVMVYGDESIQNPEDLERAPEAFDGVNLKLIKCGGLDVAARMCIRARELGMRVMLGSMSESSLGCGAMLALGGGADLLDLDGPWLIRNDPFEGLSMNDGQIQFTDPRAVGIGVRLRAGHQLDFVPIGG